ncbi:YwqG family protein [Streptomyces sp. NPDC097619]|uniref:YwqG family protein n=1 Tax=Streptomyces sp. NPDC097619 TaxID=3157228 RepID=UPI0033311694
MTFSTAEALHDHARRHLSPEVAARWTGALAPGIRLDHAGEGPVAGRLGGLPELPSGVPWPVWEGHGPLSHVASLDCAALVAAGGATGEGTEEGVGGGVGEAAAALPRSGTLLFFHFDGRVDGGDAFVNPSDPETRPGAQVLFVPAGIPVRACPAPDGLPPYPEVPLTARVGLTVPAYDAPALRAAFPGVVGGPEWGSHPVNSRGFKDGLRALDRAAGHVRHRFGGHPVPVQGAVELEMAAGVLGSWRDPGLDEEATGWVLLAQFDTDEAVDMMWGDAGTLYWLIRPADLAAGRFDRAGFVWQCC